MRTTSNIAARSIPTNQTYLERSHGSLWHCWTWFLPVISMGISTNGMLRKINNQKCSQVGWLGVLPLTVLTHQVLPDLNSLLPVGWEPSLSISHPAVPGPQVVWSQFQGRRIHGWSTPRNLARTHRGGRLSSRCIGVVSLHVSCTTLAAPIGAVSLIEVLDL